MLSTSTRSRSSTRADGHSRFDALRRRADRPRDLSSLKLLGSVGEPINPEVWLWYYRNVGKERCPVVDTWWQTETGGILITPLPGAHSLSRERQPALLRRRTDRRGRSRQAGTDGEPRASCASQKPWPGIMRHDLGRPRRGSCRPISAPSRGSTSPVTAAASTKTVTTGCWAASTT